VRASYGDNYQRLRDLKGKFDPANLFRVNAKAPVRPQADLGATTASPPVALT